MTDRQYISLRILLCFVVLFTAWINASIGSPSTHSRNDQSISPVENPVDVSTITKVSAPSGFALVLLATISGSHPVSDKHHCYTEPVDEKTRLLQFKSALVRTLTIASCP